LWVSYRLAWLLRTDVSEEHTVTIEGWDMEPACLIETFLPASRPNFLKEMIVVGINKAGGAKFVLSLVYNRWVPIRVLNCL